jgi:hypothetical protein
MKQDTVTMLAQLTLSLLLFMGFFVALYVAWFSPVKVEADRLRVIDTMVGVLGATFTMVVGFWFARQRNAVAEKTNEE